MKNTIKKSMAIILALLVMLAFCESSNIDLLAANTMSVSYRCYVQGDGWKSWVSNGAFSGTKGESKRIEGIQVKLANQKKKGGIKYRSYVQTKGWVDWSKDGAFNGTKGEQKRIETVQIKLYGEMANYYDVYYRVYAQGYGWLGWARNGESAGTMGLSKRIEGIQIKLETKTDLMRVKYITGLSCMKVTKVSSIYMYLSNENVVTKGYTSTVELHVYPSNYNEKISFYSSDTNIATVDSNGVITGVNVGKATITAKSASGVKKTIDIEVVENIGYWNPSADVYSYSYGNPEVAPVRVYYSGDTLVLDTYIINNKMFRATQFDYIDINIYNALGNIVASKRFTNVPLNMESYSVIEQTFYFENALVSNVANGARMRYDYWYQWSYD